MKKNAAKEVDDALAWLVAEREANVLRPEEFTAEMAYQRMKSEGIPTTIHTLRNRFKRMDRSGELTSRKALIDGKWANVYLRVGK